MEITEAKREEIEQKMQHADWRMQWEILPGITSPGISPVDPAYILDDFGIERDLSGKRAIDIGAWDGPLAFELERRGALTLATDIQHPDATAFNTAKGILGSSMDYLQASVYDLPELLEEKYDVVVFRAVYYHLKNPIGAFEAIAQIMNPGAVLCVEGECLLYYAERLDGREATDSQALKAIKRLAGSDIPVTLCYPGTYKRGENWFIPNLACFQGWMRAAGLEIQRHRFWEDRSLNGQRLIAIARRTDAPQIVEHTVLEKGWSRAH
ncbi:MAG: class I SAM-dependent methyltransferase [Planctomycetota bacterium]|jgi:SAM-dependent methyltransferase